MNEPERNVAYYHLPGLFEFYELYRIFLPLLRRHREYFYEWCDIGSFYGAPEEKEIEEAGEECEAEEEAEESCAEELLPGHEAEEEEPEAEEGEAEEDGEAAESAAQTALAVLGADLSRPWPEEISALRELFERRCAIKDAPDDGFTYVSAPMPEGCGSAACLAGVRCEAGAPVAVRYALPSTYAPEPPAGLEDAAWIGDNNSGWWVTHIDLHGGGAM